jgi:hypothetical protein
MKVKLTNKVNRFGYLGKKYVAGDIFEVDPQFYDCLAMEIIPEPVIIEEDKPKKKVKKDVLSTDSTGE